MFLTDANWRPIFNKFFNWLQDIFILNKSGAKKYIYFKYWFRLFAYIPYYIAPDFTQQTYFFSDYAILMVRYLNSRNIKWLWVNSGQNILGYSLFIAHWYVIGGSLWKMVLKHLFPLFYTPIHLKYFFVNMITFIKKKACTFWCGKHWKRKRWSKINALHHFKFQFIYKKLGTCCQA